MNNTIAQRLTHNNTANVKYSDMTSIYIVDGEYLKPVTVIVYTIFTFVYNTQEPTHKIAEVNGEYYIQGMDEESMMLVFFKMV